MLLLYNCLANKQVKKNFCSLLNGFPSCFLFRGKWFGTECREFAFVSVPRYGIPSIFLFRNMIRIWIPWLSCSEKQPEFRRDKPFVSSIPFSAELFLVLAAGGGGVGRGEEFPVRTTFVDFFNYTCSPGSPPKYPWWSEGAASNKGSLSLNKIFTRCKHILFKRVL